MPDAAPVQGFPFRSVQFVITGSANAALVPNWLLWMHHVLPQVTTHAVLTAAAERFVTLGALRQLASGRVARDSWDDPAFATGYRDLESQAECFAIFPATLNTLMKLAGGLSDSPALLALQTTRKPIGVAPAVPGTNEVIDRRLGELRRRSNVVFAATGPAVSVVHGATGETGFDLPGVLSAITQLATARCAEQPA